MEKLFKVLMWLVTMHSFCVGLALVFMPANFMPLFGFDINDAGFFRAQGGVFHVIMAVVYLLTGLTYKQNNVLVIITLLSKALAVIFLFTWYLFISDAWMILLSGITDALIFFTVLIIYIVIEKK